VCIYVLKTLSSSTGAVSGADKKICCIVGFLASLAAPAAFASIFHNNQMILDGTAALQLLRGTQSLRLGAALMTIGVRCKKKLFCL